MTRPMLAPLLAAAIWAASGSAAGPAYYPDDPIAVDPETEDASGVRPWNLNGPYDFVENSFFQDADVRDIRALNVNTADEVPDSSWFTNRVGLGPLDPADVTSPHGAVVPPAEGTWTIVAAKTEGRSPGFVIRDGTGAVFFLKFDPPSNPEMASGAEIISTHVLHAAGYHVPENSIAVVLREQLAIDPSVTAPTPSGGRRPFTMADVDAVLARAARRADGGYRVLASRQLPGTDLGPFRYHGTRPDDPNDIYPHEHRRELRGLRVFAAWLNHDDSRSLNTRDTLVTRDGRRLVWHHLLDFGSTLGSGTTQSDSPRAGNEYIWESRPTLLTILTLGFYVRPWITVKYPGIPAVGRFEAEFFQPDLWKPDYPNPAFDNAREDDAFWAARRVAAFTDDVVKAVVGAARYSDPRTEQYLVDTLIRRRDKVLARWMNGVLPLVDCAVAEQALTCRNAAVDLRLASAPRAYRVRWFRLDNATGATTPAGDEVTSATPAAPVPEALRDAGFAAAEIVADHPEHPRWATAVKLAFRQEASGAWTTVGVTRQ
jgi:hypothetical protein